jgi:phosphoadenosine phosphosulfate reductase
VKGEINVGTGTAERLAEMKPARAPQVVSSDGGADDLLMVIDDAARELDNASAEEIIAWALGRFSPRITLATGFGAEGVALIDIALKLDPALDIFFLDTGFLFPETYELRDQLEARYGIKIRAIEPVLTPALQEELHGPSLWAASPDQCCALRKIEPLKRALAGFDAWVAAIRRDQTAARATARVVEWDSRWQLVKVNPLANWTSRDVWRYVVRNGLPYNPLHDIGYSSIGCVQCTRAVRAGEDDRAGRWPGHQKTECGLHGGGPVITLQRSGTGA